MGCSGEMERSSQGHRLRGRGHQCSGNLKGSKSKGEGRKGVVYSRCSVVVVFVIQ